MKKKLVLLVIACIMTMVLCGCEGEMGMVGNWTIKEISAGDITMNESDIEDMGLESGALKLKRSGKAELNILGDEYTGTWEFNDDGTATVTYGNDDEDGMVGTATKEGKVMNFKDAQGSTYVMERF